jgi:hypothetical protein
MWFAASAVVVDGAEEANARRLNGYPATLRRVWHLANISLIAYIECVVFFTLKDKTNRRGTEEGKKDSCRKLTITSLLRALWRVPSCKLNL